MSYNVLQKDVISTPIRQAQGRLREESLTSTAVFFKKCNIMMN